MNHPEEHVLVFPAHRLEAVGNFRGFTADVERYLPVVLDSQSLFYLPRSLAEDDPTHKQLVPYVILRCREEIFCYRRGGDGGEKRLHDRLSIGIGGHICREDGADGTVAYDVGFQRELDEEVQIDSGYKGRILGLVHDDSTPVGAVHVGVVHLFDLDEARVRPRDPALADGAFQPISRLRDLSDRLESWSRFVLEVL